ncbi:hypothetical protein FCV25MIE_16550 [Fagus crenata]
MTKNANENDGEIMHDKEDKDNKMILEMNNWKDVMTIPQCKGTKLQQKNEATTHTLEGNQIISDEATTHSNATKEYPLLIPPHGDVRRRSQLTNICSLARNISIDQNSLQHTNGESSNATNVNVAQHNQLSNICRIARSISSSNNIIGHSIGFPQNFPNIMRNDFEAGPSNIHQEINYDEQNPFVRTFCQLARRPDLHQCKLIIKAQAPNQPQYSLPTASQVEAIVVGGDEAGLLSGRDILVQTLSGALINIQDVVGYYDPLQYPLLFPFRMYEWEINSKTNNGAKVTCREYYAISVRGLPHVHMLLIIDENDKLRNPDDYNQIVRAEIPAKEEQLQLHCAVLKHVIMDPAEYRI